MKHHLIILGCGNVAAHLVPAFLQAGVPVARIVGIHEPSARALGEKWGVPWSLVEDPLPEEGDIIISALRDGGAAGYWNRMKIGSRMLVHTAGSLPLAAAAPFASRCGVLYLLQSISRNRALDFKKIPVLIEGNSPEALETVRGLAEKLSPNVYEMDSVQRASLHLAAVFANNFTNAACCAAAKLAQARQVPFELLLPLIDETAAKLHAMTPLEAQTGPARRWDENVMKKQLDSLADTPDLQELYRSMSLFIHKEQTGKNN